MRARSIPAALALLAGALFLAVPRGSAEPPKEDAKAEAGKGLKIKGKLTDDDPKDTVRQGSYAKIHEYKMKAGKAYKIEMISREDEPGVKLGQAKLDPFLRLENPDGKQVAFDDDGAGYPNARIVYQADRDGTYKIICTTYAPNQTGKYLLTVAETKLSPLDKLLTRVKTITAVGPDQQKQILGEMEKFFQENKDKLTGKEAQLAMQVGNFLEQRGSKDLAGQAYTNLGKVLAGAEDKKAAELGKMLVGAGRRMRLPGNTMEVKGKTLDGKDLDWKSYRGKVVLVDFWATWCGPCVGELPNVQKLYKAYHGKGFDVVGISLDFDKGRLEKFVKDKEMAWACITPDGGGRDLSTHYGVLFIPMAILVDREGRVVSMQARGPELERLLEKYLGPAGKGDKEKDKDSN